MEGEGRILIQLNNAWFAASDHFICLHNQLSSIIHSIIMQ